MRSARWAVICVAALLSFGCGGDDGGDGDDLGGAGAGGGTCGDGVVDQALGEDCEPAIPVTQTCSGLGMGIGMVMCGLNCQFELMCGPAADSITAGNGGGGASG